jgi:hypothetical protein
MLNPSESLVELERVGREKVPEESKVERNPDGRMTFGP